MTAIPEKYQDIVQKRTFAMFATIMPDGQPQITPVWVDAENGRILINTAKGRQKHKNVQRDPRVAVTLIDPDNPYRYVEVRGRVTEMTENGADSHIDKMAKKYLGKDKYPFAQPGERRILLKIEPEHVHGMG
jgi:PPOX class probable F420-dependent enzyme